MAVNVKSMFFATKHALAHLRNNRRSYIVNVGSISSFVGQASTPVYTTSKHAVLGLTRSIALDYAADGIRCNCVCPGITDTPMLREHLDSHARSRGDAGRPAAPRGDGRGADARLDVARSILFFSCEDSSGVTGTSLTIDCGYLTAAEWETKGKTAFHGAAMPLKLACADFTFPLLPHDNVLDLIAMLGFDGVDIGLFEGRSHLWPSREFRNVSRSARELGRKLADRGLRAADVFLQTAPDFVPYAINHPQPARRRKVRGWFLKTLDYAAGCGAGHVTLLPGVYFDDEPRAASWARCVRRAGVAGRAGQGQGIIFGVEAHLGSIAPSPREAERLVQAVPGLTLTLDYTHFARKGLPDTAVEPLSRMPAIFMPAAHAKAASRLRLPRIPSTTGVFWTSCGRPDTVATSASSMCGRSGSTATKSTTCRKPSASATSFGSPGHKNTFRNTISHAADYKVPTHEKQNVSVGDDRLDLHDRPGRLRC